MSTRLQVVMDEAELEEIQAAAEHARLTVSAWVRRVLRAAREGDSAVSDEPGRVQEGRPGYGAPEGASPRSPVLVDHALLRRVMDRYRFPTPDAALHFALQRAADPPMTREELLALRGSGWEGDLDALRSGPPPQEPE